MDSLVLELQREAYNASSSISSLLRKAYVVAKKLKIVDIENWLNYELNGYPEKGIEIPDYRYITGEIQGWNPYHGWIPVTFENPKEVALISKRKVVQPITEIEVLSKDESSVLSMSLPAELVSRLSRANGGLITKFHLSFSITQAIKMIETVRNIVLDWALKLEDDGVLGEGMSFTQEEKQVVNEKHYNVNHFYNVQNLQFQQQSNNSTQQMNHQHVGGSINDLKSLHEILQQLKRDIFQLNQEDREEAQAEIATIEAQATSQKPKSVILRESVSTLRKIVEGAGGKLAADYLPKLVHFLSSL
ncbi:hypothetical protein [Paenibacillus sp. R14(2021)]|uniref:AbiTii domain-containing protein n=1 Tax=Paenibacillus sp. R14(2021) TaxID=2859228 RepID=UPI001C613FF6|nr:hypothetical protein [Paenibacillus sp. R14(2021)]